MMVEPSTCFYFHIYRQENMKLEANQHLGGGMDWELGSLAFSFRVLFLSTNYSKGNLQKLKFLNFFIFLVFCPHDVLSAFFF